MPEITLEMLDANQAAEVRRVIEREIPQARIVDGAQDLLGGTTNPDRHITFEYHDEQIIDNVLNQHFLPQNKNWRDFQTS